MTTDEGSRLEIVLGRVLRVGAIASTSLLAVGLVLSLAWSDSMTGRLFAHAGLVILIATPVARVVVSVFEFAAARDWPFLTFTTTVLVILLGSLLVAVWH